jgi:putative restriction endonuclease
MSALASHPQSLNLSAMPELGFGRPPDATPLSRETLLAGFDRIGQFARGGRRAPHKPLLLLYALARLKHDRQTEIRFDATEAIVNPLLRSYGPWGSGAHVSYPYGRLVTDGLWRLPDRAQLLDAQGNVREKIARERDAPAGFTPDLLATFEREPELIDVVALHLLERHFAPGLHEEILEAVGLELGNPVAIRRRDRSRTLDEPSSQEARA